MTRRFSHCTHNGHNSRTCPNRGVKLFGVRLIRKSASMSNLSQFSGSNSASSSPVEGAAHADGYASEDFVPGSSSSPDRKKDVPWSEDEHRMFLLGLQKLGKGDWRGISRNYVVSRTPMQLASHAQKYFIRQSNVSRRKTRSSLFDIVADEPGEPPMVSQDLLAAEPPQAEAQSNDQLPIPTSLDEENKSTDSNNSNDGKTVPPQPCYPVVYPVYHPTFFPFPFPFPYWMGYKTEANKSDTHEVVKPMAVHSRRAINVGMSKLSLGDSGSTSVSLRLEGSSRQSAFHANPASCSSSGSPIHAV